jgi:hypothetical protein
MNILKNFRHHLTRKRIVLSLIALGIATAASCLKKTDLQVDDLGSAIEAQDIALALDDAFGPIDYNSIKDNEMTDLVISQRIQDGAVQNIQEQNITVKGIENTSSYLRIISHTIMTTFSSSGNVVDERDWDQYFPKYSGFAFSVPNKPVTSSADATAPTASKLAVQSKGEVSQQATGDLDAPLYTFKLIQSLALASCYDGGTYPETCHNLAVVEFDWKVPAVSANQHGCNDPYNCYIKAKRVEFDLLQKYNLDSDGKPRRVHYSLVLSQEVPFTSRVLEYCTRALYDIGADQKVLADMCYKVNRYSFGTP